jgi:hypothetical protein
MNAMGVSGGGSLHVWGHGGKKSRPPLASSAASARPAHCSIVTDDAACRCRICSHQTPPCLPEHTPLPFALTSLNPCIAMNEGKREMAVGRAMFCTASREDPAGESRKRGPRLSPSLTRKLLPQSPPPPPAKQPRQVKSMALTVKAAPDVGTVENIEARHLVSNTSKAVSYNPT